jgi:hypothetical protein
MLGCPERLHHELAIGFEAVAGQRLLSGEA